MENEKRLIDANEVPKNKFFLSRPTLDKIAIREVLANCPTVDAVEVVHGEWIYHECVSSCDGAISGYSCSKCCIFVDEEIFDMDEFHKDFCGHCGAKMDGGNEDG